MNGLILAVSKVGSMTLLEELRKDVIVMVTVYYRNIIEVKIRKEKKVHRVESRRNQA